MANKKVPRKVSAKPNTFLFADWKNENEYPDPQNTRPLKWAWEFLRRNPDYQKDSLLVSPLKKEIGKGKRGSDSKLMKIYKKWDLLDLPDPMLEKDYEDFFWPWSTQMTPQSGKLEFDPYIFYFAFSLDKPIEPQLERAKLIYKSQSSHPKLTIKKKSKRRSDLYSIYLRIIDGRKAGATHKEIALHLISKEFERDAKLARATIKDSYFPTAKKLMEKDFKAIAQLDKNLPVLEYK
jgi:hypothetical protein